MSDTKAELERLGFEVSLHRDWYRDPAYHAREREAIFARDWFCVGRAEDWEGPGSHRVLDWFGESLLVLRNQEGLLRAFYNVCRHRGSRLCSADEGGHGAGLRGGVVGGKLIRCPYHAWSYDLDGNLVNAPFLADQPGFDPEGIALHPVGVGEWGGFVFLNLTPDSAPDFDEMVAGPAERLARLRLNGSV